MTAPKKPADRARKAAKAKSPNEPFKAEIKGRSGNAKVTIKPMTEWGYAWKQHAGDIEHGIMPDYGAFVEDILEPSDLAAFNATRPTSADVDSFFMVWCEAMGLDLGESVASQAS